MSGSLSKTQGHEAERSTKLHNKLKKILMVEGKVSVKGSSDTKTDILIGDVGISQKTPSGKSTQVWIPSKNTLFTHISNLEPVKNQLLDFLGSPTHTRKTTSEITDFKKVLKAFNKSTTDGTLLKKMLLQVSDEKPVQYISWVTKKRAGGGITVIESDPPNFGGKTVLSVDLLLFLFFNTTTKTSKAEEVFNRYSGKDKVSVRGEIVIDGEDYIIVMELDRKKSKAGE
jgi:hypothetical protein